MIKFTIRTFVIFIIYCAVATIGIVYCFSYGTKTPSQVFVAKLIGFPLGYFQKDKILWFVFWNGLFWNVLIQSFMLLLKRSKPENDIDLLDN